MYNPANDFYGHIITDVKFASKSSYYLQGGIGVGKTAFLQCLRQQLKEEKTSCELYSGKNYSRLYAYIRDIDSRDDYETRTAPNTDKGKKSSKSDIFYVLIDDFDTFLVSIATKYDRKNFEVIFNAMVKYFKSFPDIGGKLVMTSSSNVREVADKVGKVIKSDHPSSVPLLLEFIEYAGAKWQRVDLAPCTDIGWRMRVEKSIRSIYRTPDASYNEDSSQMERKSQQPITANNLINDLEALTGFHPYLYGVAMTALVKLSKDLHPEISSGKMIASEGHRLQREEQEQLIFLSGLTFKLKPWLRTQLLREGFQPIHDALEMISKIQDPLCANAMSILVDIASKKKLFVKNLPPKVGNLLLDQALIRPEADGHLEVPGELIRDAILQFQSASPASSYQLKPEQNDPERGELVAIIGGVKKTIPLKKTAWRILHYLYNKRPQSVSIDELQNNVPSVKGGGELSPPSIRSTINRLEAKLELEGINKEDIIKRPRPSTFLCTLP